MASYGRKSSCSVDVAVTVACFLLAGLAACYFLNYFIAQILSDDSLESFAYD